MNNITITKEKRQIHIILNTVLKTYLQSRALKTEQPTNFLSFNSGMVTAILKLFCVYYMIEQIGKCWESELL